MKVGVANERARSEWKDLELELVDSAEKVFDEADAVILVTEWPEFRSLDFASLGLKMKQKLVLDGRGLMDGKALSAAGIRLLTLGRSNR